MLVGFNYTYRLGAVDQLRSFADVSHTDFLVAYEPNDMNKIMKKFAKKDIVFVDTVGRSPRNANQLQSNLEFLSKIGVDETYLVLSATELNQKFNRSIEQVQNI